MPLPALSDWGHTRIGLHQAAQVIGAIRKLDATPLPNYLHLALEVVPEGVTSGQLAKSIGGELLLDYRNTAVVYTCPDGGVSSVPIPAHTQTTLMDAVLEAMAKAGHPANPDRSKVTGTDSLRVHPGMAEEYLEASYSIYTAIARFKARLFGPMSRIAVWPHGFDQSFLWFARGFDEEKDPHMNFGFSPGSPGFERPYVYAFARPLPPGFFDIQIPAGARWQKDGWSGIVIDYDTLAGEEHIEAALERHLLDIHAAIVPLLV